MAYSLAKPRLALIQCQTVLTGTSSAPGHLTNTSSAPSQGDLAISVCFGCHVSVANTLTLLSKASATVTVYRGHCQTLLPVRINSLFIMCIGIIRNNSLVGGRARGPG